MVSGGSESERQLRGISTLNALRADGAITSFRVKAPHKSRWAFIVRLLRGAFIIVLVQCMHSGAWWARLGGGWLVDWRPRIITDQIVPRHDFVRFLQP